MGFWAGKEILVGLGGGIAAYKTLELIRTLRQEGAAVTVVPTQAALHFVTRLTLQSLAEGAVFDDLFSAQREMEMGHITLARRSELVIVAPATADLMARMAGGHGDDLLTTLLLARRGPVLLAPAMNAAMWEHPATRRNVALLRGDGIHLVGPESGALACGENGPGRMSEPGAILAAARGVLSSRTLAGRRLLITAGPTQEPIDPVRFISNRSTGRMGVAVAMAMVHAGAEVTLVHGPMSQPLPPGARSVAVVTAQEMFDTVMTLWPEMDGAILTAAVGDYRLLQPRAEKIKKQGETDSLTLELTTTPDILATISRLRRPEQMVVGFAAETGEAMAKARGKIVRKGCHLLVVNDVSEPGSGFAGETNRVTLLWADGREEAWPLLPKEAVGERLVATLARQLGDK